MTTQRGGTTPAPPQPMIATRRTADIVARARNAHR